MIRITLFIGLTLMIFLSCKGKQHILENNQQDITIIQVEKGEHFMIPLKSSYGNGYQWELEIPLDSKMIQLDSTNVSQPKTDSTLEPNDQSSESWENFYFSVKKKGKTIIHFHQVRVWDKKKPLNRQKFQIIAQ